MGDKGMEARARQQDTRTKAGDSLYPMLERTSVMLELLGTGAFGSVATLTSMLDDV